MTQEKKKRVRIKPKVKEGVGRKIVTVDWDFVDKALCAGCSAREIAAALDIHEDTLFEHVKRDKKMSWTDFSGKGKAKGELCLRQKQYETALAGCKTLLVWLGKNRLDQRENPVSVEISAEMKKAFTDLAESLDSLRKPPSIPPEGSQSHSE